MAERRLIYFIGLFSALVFYWAYREWVSWLLLMGLVWLPWLSLLLSLPAMLTCRMRADCPAQTTAGTPVSVSLVGKCPLPLPPVKSTLLVRNNLTGQQCKLSNGGSMPTQHSGGLTVSLTKTWCYDYLGLIRLPIRKKKDAFLLVRPKTEIVQPTPDLSRYLSTAWRPKPGGGFAENHELRLYRPGDNLRQVHWKLSAKTGKLVYREPMEALRGRAMLTVHLSGTPEVLDSKLGRLHYLSLYLLEKEVPHRICCLTGNGLMSWDITCEADALAAQAALLAIPAAEPVAGANWPAAAWRYHIGGDGNET